MHLHAGWVQEKILMDARQMETRSGAGWAAEPGASPDASPGTGCLLLCKPPALQQLV